MKFTHQQLLIAGAGASIFFLAWFADKSGVFGGELGSVLAYLIPFGALCFILPIMRWFLRFTVLFKLNDPLAQDRGMTMHWLFQSSKLSRVNRWVLHVNEQGSDLDLVRILAKAENQ
ncbi:hypothetical protein [Planktotalea sp.]|uniref:hypothetical protein n=1 Tax=Planktotalea sp. TaxID=2029877 RepID=UPI003296EFAD